MSETMVEPQADPMEVGVTHAGLAVQAADTGRVLLIQRSMDPSDPPEVQGTWEFPGGGLEDGEDPQTAAMREFCEETGLPIPEGEVSGGWRSIDGIYQGFVWTTPVEAAAFPELNPDLAAAEMVNPDDPQRRNPDVSAWFSLGQVLDMGSALRLEVHTTDWTQFLGGEAAIVQTVAEPEGVDMSLTAPETDQEQPAEAPAVDEPAGQQLPTGYIPWHGVVTVQDAPSGDRRALSGMRALQRPLPLPVGWQRVSAPGHNNSVVVARIDALAQVGQEIRATGVVLPVPDADDFLGLVAHFPRFGMSVDADDVLMAYDDEVGSQWIEGARVCGSTFVPIPAFHQAWGALGEPPEGFMAGEPLGEEGWDNEPQAMVASAGIDFMAAAIENFKRGPGWVTNPEDTRRLHDYWTKPGQPGYAKIGWGAPGGGDFNRCRVEVGKELTKHSPTDLRYLNQICAQWHHDALGFWPGHAPTELANEPTVVSGTVVEPIRIVEREEAALVASAAGLCAPAEWFEDPQFTVRDDRMVQSIDGTWGAPVMVSAEGQVYGHIAKWTTCHTGMPGACTSAPRSESGYAYFLLGQVLTTEGIIPCGSLTVGGGHADLNLGMRAAMAHYDNSCSVWADVNVGEDEYGIWCAGWVRPGTPPEMVVAARASKLSGDWRPVGAYGQYELMAALGVNTPGFPVPRIRIAAGLQTALVAAGVVDGTRPGIVATAPEVDMDQLADRVAAAIERRQVDKSETTALLQRFADQGREEQAALLARFE